MAVSPQPVVRSTPCLVLGTGFRGRRSNGAIRFEQIQDGGAAILDNFEWPYLRNGYLYSAHRAVIFAIAQLSCKTSYKSMLVYVRQCDYYVSPCNKVRFNGVMN